MQYKTFVACASAVLLAAGMACSDSPETPVSPTPSPGGDGSSLKATAPSPVSPVNDAQPDAGLVLVATKSTPEFSSATIPFSYEFQIKNTGGAVLSDCTAVVPGGGDSTVSYTPTCTLEFDQSYRWIVRAVYQDAAGPWSPEASFRAPAGGFIRDNEVFDPLVTGRTVGEISGPAEFLPGQGVQLLDHSSFITYRLPVNLQAGELSMMVLNADDGNPGDKSKIFSMQEGPELHDITEDDYRMTAELRGRDYCCPGTVAFRIIPGDGDPQDGRRMQLNFQRGRWYFWRFTWQTGFATLTVKEDGPNGPAIYDQSVGGWSHPYRPDPHYIHLGAPAGRAGSLDATQPGIIIKNVWASSRPRPVFPGE